MPKPSNTKKWVVVIFIFLAGLTLLTPFWVFRDLLFPFVTSKAFYLRITVELAFPFYLLLLLQKPEYRPSLKNPLNISILAFLLLNLIAGIFGVNPLRSIWGNFERMGGVFYLAHLTLIYFYVLALGQISPKYLRLFLHMVVALGAVITLDGVLVRLTHNNFLLNDPSYPRVSGTFGNPIFIASFLILPMLLTVFFALSEQALWKKIAYWIIILAEAWVIFLSETRGAVVGLGIGIFIAAVLFVILTPNKRWKIWGGSALAVFTVTALLLFSFHSQLPQGGLLHRVFNLKDSNTEARIVQWGVALKGYKDRPLLGVGPENYYFISNKYYNPQIFQYDQSWFDKPHNYLIEVLVTTGIFGFLAYAGVIVFSFWAMWEAYHKEVLLLGEFCVLVCGLLAYQIQNLFVFDTVGASLAFFAFIGFMGYLWHEAHRPEGPEAKKNKTGFDNSFAYSAFFVAVLAMIYLVYVGNVTGIEVAKDVNYGYAYATVDPQIAKSYFEAGQNSPFDFDPIQFASKYADFATGLAANPGSQSSQFVAQNLQDAIAAEQDAIARVPNDPTAWQELSNLYLTEAIYNKTALDPKAVDAAQTAMDLAPKRPEPEQMMARLDISQNNFPAAQGVLQDIINNIPQDSAIKLQLAVLYNYAGQTAQALQLGQSVLDGGYVPLQASQIDWMAQDYDKQNNFVAAAKIYRLAVKIEPGNLQDQWSLAQDDVKVGDKAEAIQLAQSLIQSDPKDAAHFQQFIDSLK